MTSFNSYSQQQLRINSGEEEPRASPAKLLQNLSKACFRTVKLLWKILNKSLSKMFQVTKFIGLVSWLNGGDMVLPLKPLNCSLQHTLVKYECLSRHTILGKDIIISKIQKAKKHIFLQHYCKLCCQHSHHLQQTQGIIWCHLTQQQPYSSPKLQVLGHKMKSNNAFGTSMTLTSQILSL